MLLTSATNTNHLKLYVVCLVSASYPALTWCCFVIMSAGCVIPSSTHPTWTSRQGTLLIASYQPRTKCSLVKMSLLKCLHFMVQAHSTSRWFDNKKIIWLHSKTSTVVLLWKESMTCALILNEMSLLAMHHTFPPMGLPRWSVYALGVSSCVNHVPSF